jgi:hypothetical protein
LEILIKETKLMLLLSFPVAVTESATIARFHPERGIVEV